MRRRNQVVLALLLIFGITSIHINSLLEFRRDVPSSDPNINIAGAKFDQTQTGIDIVPTESPSKPIAESSSKPIAESPSKPIDEVRKEEIDWTKFAYVQYATNLPYLCNSVLTFESLYRLKAKATRMLLYNDSWMVDPNNSSPESRLLVSLRDDYGVRLKPIKVLRRFEGDATWAESFTKLLAFNQTEYARVVAIDSDTNILQNIDELFLLPHTFLAMPKMYWEPQKKYYTSLLLVIEPDTLQYNKISDKTNEGGNGFDMDILNKMYNSIIVALPHTIYGVLTGEWRADDHNNFQGVEPWDPDVALKKTKILHFSDWPTAKPWLNDNLLSNAPSKNREKEIWLEFYAEFKTRRKRLCFGLAKK